jgi:hypothetical protein
MQLTKDQIERLRKARTVGNRIAKAVELADVKLTEVSAATGLPYVYVSDVSRNRWQTITVENAHKFANYFGCAIEDLFPAREAVAS